MRFLVLAVTALLGLAANAAIAQERQPSTCLAIAGRPGPLLHKASLQTAQLQSGEVRITYVGHSAFRIESPGGVVAVTDYNGMHGDGGLPAIVTMNHAHSTHYTDFPDPGIPHVLRGWNPAGDGPAEHYLTVGDMLVRNIATDLYYESILREENGNSIFVFEVSGLCIGHLGHLHHKLTPEHIAKIGRIDVLFIPVDGTYTMSQAGMIELAEQLRSSVVIPMHFFSTFSLQRFVSGMAEKFETQMPGGNEYVVSLNSLPANPAVVVLSPY